jgi:hypothetical protein
MSFGFDNTNSGSEKRYLRTPGIQTNARFVGLVYNATEQYEYFDIEIETADGRYFRERTFGPDPTKVFPKAIYKNGKQEGMETNAQAFERVQRDINTKLHHLALCFTTNDVLRENVKGISTLKEFVDAVNRAIGTPTNNINFLTVWKNSDARQKSNLILAERIKWCEPHTEGKEATIKLTKWQLENQLVEKFPYNGGATSDSPVMVSEGVATDDLPF